MRGRGGWCKTRSHRLRGSLQRWIIALGSNVGDTTDTVLRGWDAIVAILPLKRARLSRLITSAPAEQAKGGPFCNAVGVGWSSCAPETGMQLLLAIEAAHGRDRAAEGWHGARPLDLDIIDIGGQLSDDATLTLPHPRFAQRGFVLHPLAQVCPRFRDARSGRTVRQLLAAMLVGALACACKHYPEPPSAVVPPGMAPPEHVLVELPLSDTPALDELLNGWSKLGADDDALQVMRATAPKIPKERLATDSGLRRWVMFAVWRELQGGDLGANFERIRKLVDTLQAVAPQAPETLACRALLRLVLIQGPNGELAQNGLDRGIVVDLQHDLATLSSLQTFNGPGEFTAPRIADELNNQYVLGYTSSHGADGQYHSLRVRVPGSDDRVRARNGYVAMPMGRTRGRP